MVTSLLTSAVAQAGWAELLRKEEDKRKRHLEQKTTRSVCKRPDINISAIVSHAI